MDPPEENDGPREVRLIVSPASRHHQARTAHKDFTGAAVCTEVRLDEVPDTLIKAFVKPTGVQQNPKFWTMYASRIVPVRRFLLDFENLHVLPVHLYDALGDVFGLHLEMSRDAICSVSLA